MSYDSEQGQAAESAESGTCTSCGERVLLADWPEHRERVHGYRPERVYPPASPAGGDR